MNKIIKGALATGIAVALGVGLSACNKDAGAEANATAAQGPQYANVVSVTPIKKTYNNSKQVCHEETVTHHKPVKDTHQLAGTAIGAVVGGLAGHQVGGGKGKTLATVAGAVAGGYAGKKIQENHQENATYTTQENKCQTVNNPYSKVVAYEVRYQLPDGTMKSTRMDHKPGDRIELKQTTTVVTN